LIGLSKTWIFEEKSRGRSKNPSEPKSIVLIAAKHDLDPLLLTDAIVEAYRNKTQRCGSLEIAFRGEKQDSAMFLLTEGEKVISQFPVRLELIINPDFLKSLIKDIPMSSYLRKEPFQKQKRIDQLKFGMKKINVDARIVDIPPRKLVTTEFGNQFYVSNVRIADDTGSIRLSLWNGQIEKVHVGDNVEIENCYVSSFAGEQQLRIGRTGMISVM
jgi:replication factor A1